MTHLAAWLLEQIAEDERAASHAHPYDGSALDVRSYDGDSEIIVSKGRVLAECEAKRAIIEECAQILALASHWTTVEASDEEDAILAEHTLRNLALPFADRPGYDESWRP